MTRVFIALEVGEAARATLRQTCASLGHALPGVRWVDAASLHLTLAFLGELDDAAVATLTETALAVAAGAQPFALRLDRLGVFGPEWAPRVIWAGVGGETERLRAVQAALARALVAQGFPLGDRRFAAHLTLARLKRGPDEAAVERLRARLRGPALPPSAWNVADLRVMRSDLSRAGAVYTPLRIAPFRG